MKFCVVAVVITALFAFGAASADQGRIPIYEATTITSPGYYILTRDISVPSGNIITINSDDVTVDLNGHRIAISAITGELISINDGYSDIVIKNGRLYGGMNGVDYGPTAVPCQITLENLEIEHIDDYGIYIHAAGYVEIVSCTIKDIGLSAISVGKYSPSPASFVARIVSNSLEDIGQWGINLDSIKDGEIRNNRITNTGNYGIFVTGLSTVVHGHNIITGNMLTTGGTTAGIVIGDYSHGNIVSGNTLYECNRGMWILSDGNLISGNLLKDNHNSGIQVGGTNNLIEENQFQGNSPFGINFLNGNSHAYRNNMLYGNVSGPVYDPGGNTDAGGNIM